MVYFVVISAKDEVYLPASAFSSHSITDIHHDIDAVDTVAATFQTNEPDGNVAAGCRVWHPSERCREVLASFGSQLISLQEMPSNSNTAGIHSFMFGLAHEKSVETLLKELSSRAGIGNDDTRDCGNVFVMPVDVMRPAFKHSDNSKNTSLCDNNTTTTSTDKQGVQSGGSTAATGARPRVGTIGSSSNSSSSGWRILSDKVLLRILSQSTITFDYTMLTALASLLAGIGLATNNPVVIVAAMLVSPLMGPVLGLSFALFVSDALLWRKALRAELMGVAIAIAVGVVVGAAFTPFQDRFQWPTPEMMSRGETWGLLIGIAIALPSGAGVGLSITGDNASSLVGVAISASLLPPAVNAGMCWFAAIASATYDADSSAASPVTYARMGGISLALSVVNIACIIVTAIIIFAIKEAAPLPSKGTLFETVTRSIRNRHARPKVRPASAESVHAAARKEQQPSGDREMLSRPFGATFATVAAGPYGHRTSSNAVPMTLQEAVAMMQAAAASVSQPAPSNKAVARAGEAASGSFAPKLSPWESDEDFEVL